MAFRIATGRKFNLIERCAVAPTASPIADTRFPVTNAYDGFPDQPFMFGSVATSVDVIIDLNEIPNGDMETVFDGTTTLPTSAWAKKGAPTVTRVTGAGNFNSGTAGCRVVGTAAADYIYFEAPFLAGEAGRFTVASRRGTNVGEDSNVYVFNTKNGNYLKNDGTWTAARTAFQTNASTTFATQAVNFTVESFALCGGQHEVSLRIILDGGGAAASGPIYDDVYIWAGVSFASIHGHNVLNGGTASLALTSDTVTPPVANSRAGWVTTAVVRPSMYSAFSIVQSDRYWRFRYSCGTSIQVEPIWYGELVLAQSFALTHQAEAPVSYRFLQPQLRSSGDRIAYARSSGPSRILTTDFNLYSSAEMKELRDEIYRRTLGGVYPLIVVPDDTDPEVCLYARLSDEWEYVKENPALSTAKGMRWVEMPSPTFIP